MKNEDIKNNIEEAVLRRIEQDCVKIKPKSYFVIKAVLLALCVFSIFVLSVILVSFIIFSLNTRGDLFLLGFGKRGIVKFILLFPWFLLSIDALLIVLLDYLVRRFRFGYHSPIIYLFLATLVFVTTFSYLINFTSLHSQLSDLARSRHIPFAESMYGDINKSRHGEGIFRGIVSSVGDNYIVLKHSNFDGPDTELKIMVPADLNPKSFVHPGEEIYIAGDIASGTVILPYGMRKIVNSK